MYMKSNSWTNKVINIILLLAMMMSLSATLTACGEKKYECAYCGYAMEVPYTYLGGQPVCSGCAKILRGG